MQHASTLLTAEQKKAVEATIAEAEGKTSVEVVTVIASASGRYDRAEDIAGLWLGAFGLVLCWVFWPAVQHESGEWGTSPALHYAGWLAVLAAGFVLGALISSRVAWLRRLFTPQREMIDEVHQRARAVFYDQRMHHTAGGTGLLVYVSLFERTACILADEPVKAAIGSTALEELCHKLTALMARDPATALTGVIREAGNRLAPVLPRVEDDRNELANRVIFLD
ncbi:MAG: hypothetical protein HYV27_07395 [Candidatus Hydrogenedentes bacterium]|nr:hypothetical protein [Candidatus Hydrogenedentota bacterium]